MMIRVMDLEEFSKELASFPTVSFTTDGVQALLPNTSDLYSLYCHVRKSKALAVLEFGSGWSTLVLARALSENKFSIPNIHDLGIRHPNMFQLMTLDCERQFLDLAISRIPDAWGIQCLAIHSPAYMSQISGQICTLYSKLPAFTADFIYLDGPNCESSQVFGEIDGFSISFGDSDKTYGLPMAGDLIRLEPFLWPGTTIITDGRGANARFLKTNFKRNWQYKYDELNDQHYFHLAEPAWGKFSKKLLEFKNIESS